VSDKDRDANRTNDEAATLGPGAKGFGGEPFGPAAAARYRCPVHGLIMPRDVLWKRDNKPYCPKPECGHKLIKEES
jgi:hypothetical protein